MADREEKELQRLMYAVLEKQLQKMEVKMKHVDVLESILVREREQVCVRALCVVMCVGGVCWVSRVHGLCVPLCMHV